MSEAALCTVFGTPVPGREKYALDVYNEALQYWGRLQQEGRIERFDVVILGPTGGDLTGLILARGTDAQLDSVRHSEEYQRLLNRVQLVAQHVRAVDAYVDEGLARIMSQYTDEVGRVGV
jgi:hypothetical protein